MGGLLHDIGKVVLNDYVRFGYGIIVKLVEERHIPFIDAEVQVLGFDHALVGSMLVEKWGLPDPFAARSLTTTRRIPSPNPNTRALWTWCM